MIKYLLKSIAWFFVTCVVGLIRKISKFKQNKQKSPEQSKNENPMSELELMQYTARLRLDQIIYQKLEDLVERMNNKTTGVLLSTEAGELPDGIVPPVFRGNDLIEWMVNNMDTSEDKALYLANVLATHGYIFPIDNHLLKVENDEKYYRFQTPYYWFSNISSPKEYDYAIYLTKRSMEKDPGLKLDDYEAEYLKKLKVIYYKNWLYVNMQAEAELNVTKKLNNSNDKQILDSQERAFWDLHRPMPDVKTKSEFDHDKLMSFKEIAKWNTRNVMRAHINFSKEMVL